MYMLAQEHLDLLISLKKIFLYFNNYLHTVPLRIKLSDTVFKGCPLSFTLKKSVFLIYRHNFCSAVFAHLVPWLARGERE